MKNILLKTKNLYLYLMIMPFLLTSSNVYANDIGKRIRALGGDLKSFGDFMMLIVGIAGVVLIFMGIWNLKKNADDSRQHSVSKAVIMIVAGGLMTGFVAFQSILSRSFVGSTPDNRLGKFNANDLK